MNSEFINLFKSIGVQSFIDKLQMFHTSQFFPISFPMDRERSPTHHTLLGNVPKSELFSSLSYDLWNFSSITPCTSSSCLLLIHGVLRTCQLPNQEPISCCYFKNETQRLFTISSFSYFILICCFLYSKRCLLLLLLLTLLLPILPILLLLTFLSMLPTDGSLTASSLPVWTSQCSIQSHVFLLITLSFLVTDAVKFVRILIADLPSTHKQFNDGRVEEHIFRNLDSTLKSKYIL